MTRVYYISPVGADVDYARKRGLLADLAPSLKVEFVFPAGHDNSFSLDDALIAMRACDCVVADLSLERPSCYFEVGLAQASGVPVALIMREGTILHQVAHAQHAINYRDMGSFVQAVELAILGAAGRDA